MADLKRVGLTFESKGSAEFAKSVKEINAELATNKYQFQMVQDTWDKSTKTSEKLTGRLQMLEKAYKLNEEKVRALNEELHDLENSENANSAAIAQKKKQIAQAEKEMSHYQKRIDGVNKRLESGAADIEDYGRRLENMGKSTKDLGKKLSVASAAVTGIGVIAAKTGIEFEKSMSEVQAVSGATADEMVVLEKAARDAGASTDKSAKDAADALQYMALAGWDVEDSQQALMPILKLSSAANMDLGRTSDLVTDTMSVLGLEINDLDGYLDVLAQTSRNSNTDVDQLGEAFLNVGGRLQLLGVDAKEGATALGILANNGIKGSSAGKSLNAVLTNLTAPTGRAKKALDELNISAFDTNGEFIGIEETLKLVDDATKDLTDEQRNMYLAMIGGKEHASSLSALMNGLGGEFDSLSANIDGSTGALNEMYDVATDNTMGAINELKSSLEELSLKIFDNLQPAIEWVVEKVQALTDWLNGLDEETQQIIVTVGMVVAVLGPLLVIVGTFIEKIGIITQALAPLGAKVGWLMGEVATFFGISVGWVAVAVAAIVALGVIIYKNWDSIKEWTLNLIDTITEKFQVFKQWFINLWNSIKDTIISIVQRIQNAWQTSMNYIKGNIISPLVNFFSGVFNGIWNVVSGIINKIKNAFTVMGNAVKSVFMAIRNTIVNVFSSIAGIIKSPINGIIGAINGALRAMNRIRIPKWVPGFGGAGINFSMIPMLAKGGNLLGGSAIVGEAGPELLESSGGRTTVTPLSDGGGARKRTIDIDYKEAAKAIANEFRGMKFVLDERGFVRMVDERLLEVL